MVEEDGIVLEEIEPGGVPASLPIAHEVAVGIEVVIEILSDDDKIVNGDIAMLALRYVKFVGSNGRALILGKRDSEFSHDTRFDFPDRPICSRGRYIYC